jgi:hypothetical protein
MHSTQYKRNADDTHDYHGPGDGHPTYLCADDLGDQGG